MAVNEPGLLRRGRLYLDTLRHVHPVQIHGRLLAPIRRRVARLGLPTGAPGHIEDLAIPEAPFHDPWNDADDLVRGRFCFLHRKVDLGWPPDWNPADRTLLWRFTLHYHQFLHLLPEDEQGHLCHHWVDANPPGSDPGWHPYPLSRRIAIWTRLGVQTPKLMKSLYRQAAYLARTIEWHQPGNHLLENGRALALAGSFFAGDEAAQGWWKQGIEIWRKEVRRQVLDDGGHIERSPMYHCLVLEGLADLLHVDAVPEAPQLVDSDRRVFSETIDRMLTFLVAVTHPDGGLAQFNDSTLEVAPPPREIASYATAVSGKQPGSRTEFPDSGFFLYKDDRVYLIISGGPIGPDHLPGHGHADVFSFELSLSGSRVVVDTGVHDYEGGGRRQYARSTRAHNTLTVDGVDQAECWDRFRVGRRFHPQDVAYNEDGGIAWFRGQFEGYRALIGDDIVHRRVIRCSGKNRAIHVHDRVTGRYRHHVASRLHLHPDVQIQRRDNHEVQLRRGSARLRFISSTHPVKIKKAEYYPEFGRAVGNQVLVLEDASELPTEIRYRIEY